MTCGEILKFHGMLYEMPGKKLKAASTSSSNSSVESKRDTLTSTFGG